VDRIAECSERQAQRSRSEVLIAAH
jgi:hypothetical protein